MSFLRTAVGYARLGGARALGLAAAPFVGAAPGVVFLVSSFAAQAWAPGRTAEPGLYVLALGTGVVVAAAATLGFAVSASALLQRRLATAFRGEAVSILVPIIGIPVALVVFAAMALGAAPLRPAAIAALVAVGGPVALVAFAAPHVVLLPGAAVRDGRRARELAAKADASPDAVLLAAALPLLTLAGALGPAPLREQLVGTLGLSEGLVLAGFVLAAGALATWVGAVSQLTALELCEVALAEEPEVAE